MSQLTETSPEHVTMDGSQAMKAASQPTAAERGAQIRVLVVDDHEIVRIGLVALIESEPDFRVVAEADGGRHAVELYKEHKPDVTVMDLRMPDMDGVTAAQGILQIAPEAGIIMLTSYDGDDNVYRALEAGVRGYLLKRQAIGKDMLTAIRKVHAGQRFIPAEVATVLADHVHLPKLSSREIEVLRLVAAGKANKLIADELAISEGTVKIHLARIMDKLGVKQRTEAVTVALKRGIIEL